MKRLSCNTMIPLFSKHRSGELQKTVEAAVEIHLATCDTCRQAYHVWEGLRRTVSETSAPVSDPAFRKKMLSLVMPSLDRRIRRDIRVKRFSMAAIPPMAVLLGALVLFHFRPSQKAMDDTQSLGLRRLASASLPYSPPKERFLKGQRITDVDIGTTLYASSDATVDVLEAGPDGVRFLLFCGVVIAEIGPVLPSYRFIIETPNGEIEARGTVFSAAVYPDSKDVVRVSQGVVEVRPKKLGNAVSLQAGNKLIIDKRGIQEIRPLTEAESEMDSAQIDGRALSVEMPKEQTSADASLSRVEKSTRHAKTDFTAEIADSLRKGSLDKATALLKVQEKTDPQAKETRSLLVELAQAYRLVRRYEEAAAVYQKLISEFPDSPAALNSLVSLGELEMAPLNRPNAAEAHLALYLQQAPDGVLAEQARADRVRALRKAGKQSDLIRAAAQYLERHPAGQARYAMLRYQIEAYIALGDCQNAVQRFSALSNQQPDSRDTREVSTALKQCKTAP